MKKGTTTKYSFKSHNSFTTIGKGAAFEKFADFLPKLFMTL